MLTLTAPLAATAQPGRGDRHLHRKQLAAPIALYRILTAHDKDAAGGAYDYLAHGKMVGGFALVARAMKQFNPDSTWQKV